MKKLLILQNELSAYNVPTFNEIAKSFDLTLGYYTKDKSKQECKFKKILLKHHKIGPIIWINNIHEIANHFDIVCFVPDMHVLSYCLLPFGKRNYKVVNWGIGFRVSYIHPFVTNRKHNILDRIYQKVVSACDASIFYMEKAKDFWENTSFDMKRIFVAPNTTEVYPIEFNPSKKKNLLFIGTLYRGKGIDLLLDSFKKAKDMTKNSVQLVIIGDGEMKDSIIQYIQKNNLQDSVQLKGAIYEESRLAKEFQESLLCISPSQGGLSCPKSMGYGVPFVCRKDAITGGEIYHITNGINGIHYESDLHLTNILVDAMNFPEKYIEMGRKAKDYYDNHATIQHMARGAIDAFDYVINCKSQ